MIGRGSLERSLQIPGQGSCRRRLMLLSLFAWLQLGAACQTPVRSNEEVVFFPTVAHLSPDQQDWIVPVHAWVLKRELDSSFQQDFLDRVETFLDAGADADQAILNDRASWFLADSESRRQIDLELGQESYSLGPTALNGHVLAELKIHRDAGDTDGSPAVLNYNSLGQGDATQVFAGHTLLVAARGLSVISDIDDTLKISDVQDKRALVANTLARPFAIVPGMPALLDDLADRGAVFHYVSASPWQLYPALSGFFQQEGLPDGSFDLSYFSVADLSAFKFATGAHNVKPKAIEALLTTFPERDFILIGDAGEQDPEIYGDVARRHPGQIRAILIRRVDPSTDSKHDYANVAFKDLPRTLWIVFDEPDEARVFLSR